MHEVLPCAKRLRVFFAGATLADSVRAQLLVGPGYAPTIFFPTDDVDMARLSPSGRRTRDEALGDSLWWHVGSAADAAWSHAAPPAPCAGIAGHVAFVWKAMERWMEEEQDLLGHARHPRVRIDTLRSARRVRVTLRGHVLADTRDAVFLFETNHPMRPYVRAEDIAWDLLAPSATRTVCPYKGVAAYHDALIGGVRVRDIAWSYAEPFAEVGLIRGRLAFYPELVDALEIAPR